MLIIEAQQAQRYGDSADEWRIVLPDEDHVLKRDAFR